MIKAIALALLLAGCTRVVYLPPASPISQQFVIAPSYPQYEFHRTDPRLHCVQFGYC